MANLYAEEAGPGIRLATDLDLTAAISVDVLAIDPDGEEFVLDASVTADKDTGLLTAVLHTKTALTLTEAGAWVLHARAHFAAGPLRGDPASLRIW